MISLSPSRTLRALMTCALISFGGLAHAQQIFRVTTIPEEAATEQVRKFTPLASYLEKKLGVKVEFTPVSDYPAAVEVLINPNIPMKIRVSSAFGGGQMPDGRTVAFGERVYRSPSYRDSIPCVNVRANVAFGGIEIRERSDSTSTSH